MVVQPVHRRAQSGGGSWVSGGGKDSPPGERAVGFGALTAAPAPAKENKENKDGGEDHATLHAGLAAYGVGLLHGELAREARTRSVACRAASEVSFPRLGA